MITVTKGDRVIRINDKHRIYRQDVEDNFDHYFNAVEHNVENGFCVVDYSAPALHKVIGFDLFLVMFPFTAEPIDTTQQYLDFAGLQEGQVVIDLGAYSGLTAILFKQEVGPNGKVVTVEADGENLKAAKLNIDKFEEVAGLKIDYVHAAAWNHCNGLTFSTEGAMGSMVSDSTRLGATAHRVPSVTLSKIVEMYNLDRVDFIKCDIEGAERVVFDDTEFFKRFKPKIIVELHGGAEKGCISSLERAGYTCTKIKQEGSKFPLLGCV